MLGPPIDSGHPGMSQTSLLPSFSHCLIDASRDNGMTLGQNIVLYTSISGETRRGGHACEELGWL